MTDHRSTLVQGASMTRSDPSDIEICRICHSGCNRRNLVRPCSCIGSLRFCHKSCLKRWIFVNASFSCELCQTRYHIRTRLKSMKKWRRPRIDSIEKRGVIVFITSVLMILTCIPLLLWIFLSPDNAATYLRDSIGLAIVCSISMVFIAFSFVLIFVTTGEVMYPIYKRWRFLNQRVIIMGVRCTEVVREGDPLSVRSKRINFNGILQEPLSTADRLKLYNYSVDNNFQTARQTRSALAVLMRNTDDETYFTTSDAKSFRSEHSSKNNFLH